MIKNRSSKSSLFLMELILVILFFALSAAVCMQIFAAARQTTEQSRNLSNASIVAQNGAETYKSCAGDLPQTAGVLGGQMEHGEIVLWYDSNWNAIDGEDGDFALILTPQDPTTALVNVYRGDRSEPAIFSLTVKATGGV